MSVYFKTSGNEIYVDPDNNTNNNYITIPTNRCLVKTTVLFLGFRFQENVLKTIIQLENTFFDLAESCNQNCLVICDRGVMDASACTSFEQCYGF